MLLQFIGKEIIESLNGPRFLITFLICAVLILTSLWTGYQLFETERSWYATAQSENSKSLTNSGSYGVWLEQGGKAIREPSRMSIFAKGVDSAIGKAATVNEHPDIVMRDSRFGLNPVFAVFGELDLAFIVKFILSLFALLFSYNTISGERELGTLKQVLSNPIGRASFIAGKAAGGIITLLIPFLAPLILGLLVLMTVFGVSFSPDEWARIGLMTVVFCIYLAAFYMLGMLTSALTRNSFVSFLLCLVFWVLSIAVLPKAAVEVAGQISPAPSIDRVEAERSSLMRQYYQDVREITTEKVNELIVAGRIGDRDAYREARQSSEREAREPLEERYEALLREYERGQVALLRTAESLARVSPTACVTFAVNRLAGTDAQLRERFLQSLRRFKEEFVAFAREKIASNPDKATTGTSTSLSVNDDGSGAPQVDFSMRVPEFQLEVAGVPQFQLGEESSDEIMSMILVDIAILAIEMIAFFAASFVAFLRYDVR